jgi:Mg-chelatase subunit ChlD
LGKKIDWWKKSISRAQRELIKRKEGEMKASYQSKVDENRRGEEEVRGRIDILADQVQEEIRKLTGRNLKEIKDIFKTGGNSLAYKLYLYLLEEERKKGKRGLASKLLELQRCEAEYERLKSNREMLKKSYEERRRDIKRKIDRELTQIIDKELIDELMRRGLVKFENDRYIFSKSKLTEILAEQAFHNITRRIKGHISSPHGKHRSKARGMGRVIYSSYKKILDPINLSCLAVIPTLRKSLERNAVNGSLDIKIDEEDLVEYERKNEIAYAIALVLDTSGSMRGGKIEGARDCALGLGYYVRKRFKRDELHVYKFSNFAMEMKFEDIIDSLHARGDTNTAAGIRIAVDGLRKKRRYEKLIWLISDGLPNEGGGLEGAIKEARRARKEKIHLTQVLLCNRFDNAKEIARACKGDIIHIPDPRNLGVFCLLDYKLRKKSRK